MGKVIVIIFYIFLSALLRLESKLIVAACRDASVIRGIFDTNSEFSPGGGGEVKSNTGIYTPAYSFCALRYYTKPMFISAAVYLRVTTTTSSSHGA
jgi:hypothetical protein